MTENPKHASLDKTFEKNREEYHQHALMKPKFEDFRLQFVGPHDQIADAIPSKAASTEDSDSGLVDIKKIAEQRAEA